MSKLVETLRRLALHEFGSHEPMHRALELIETPATGEAVVVISAREPLPLIADSDRSLIAVSPAVANRLLHAT